MASPAVASAQPAGARPATWRRYRWPQLAVARFTGRRAMRGGALWGLVFGLYVYDNAVSFDTIAGTAAKRTGLLASMASNAGLKALLGDTQGITARGGFTDWRAIGVTILVASIWGLLASTKALRGEEAAGRWELFLSGQTTPRRAAAGALAGLGAGVAAMFVLTALLTVGFGTRSNVAIRPGPGLLLALAIVSGAAMFAAVGALASEVMPTRSRAAGLAGAIFGAAFMLRALGDATSSAHWLVYLSPLGWVEQLHPLTGARPVWLLPIIALIALCGAATILLADRDLGASLLADKDAAAPRTALLGSPVLFAWRMNRTVIACWLGATLLASLLYGSLAKSTGQAFANSGALRKFTGSLTHVLERQLQLAGTRVFAGIVFLILMTLIMAFVASALGRVREDEAEGYLDNLLARDVSRPRWLAGRAGLILAAAVSAGLLGGLGFWVAAASQHSGLSVHELVLAGINSAVPATLLLGLGVLTFGFAPRLTSIVCWGLLAWAFLLDMLGSAIKVNHWVMDTSLLHHPALAPAVSPDWRVAGTYLALGAAAALLGGWRFTTRDLQSS
jgi:ABC-2 type transport system permease protein